ncbi:DM13 domain-containing protein [Nocardia sp. NPDC050710]|uniref:DM13 domain-containing protein n=1 Tax=Nocardia sp. NPDC050710 TaxID=3157220 RepID=UPI0033EA0B82
MTWLVTAVVLIAVAGALALFQPWKLFTDTTVNEAAPTVVPSAAPNGTPAADPPRPETLSQGTLISHEHATTGTVHILRLPDGSRVLRLENLDTSDGPDVHVWLTDQPVTDSAASWTSFDDGDYVDLGKMKGNKGSQNYTIPAEVDLSRFRSVDLWCDRFNVSFGAATLHGL